jgi:hypothetical protein
MSFTRWVAAVVADSSFGGGGLIEAPGVTAATQSIVAANGGGGGGCEGTNGQERALSSAGAMVGGADVRLAWRPMIVA